MCCLECRRSRSHRCAALTQALRIEAQVHHYVSDSNGELPMEQLHFVCPKTGRDIDAGIATELETLLRIKMKPIRITCPICGEQHEWHVRDAQLVKAD